MPERPRDSVPEPLSYLNGAVLVTYLPAKAGSDGLFLGGDERGAVAMVASNDNFSHIEFAEFSKPGIVRARHYHEHYEESLCVLEGDLILYVAAIDAAGGHGTLEEITLRRGARVTLAPMTGHVIVSSTHAFVLSVGKGPSPFTDRKPFTPTIPGVM